MKLKNRGVLLAGLFVAAAAFVAAGCGGGQRRWRAGGFAVVVVHGIEYKGDGDPDYILASDLPLQGSSRAQNEQIVAAIRYQLGQQDWKAGDYNDRLPVVRRRDCAGRQVGLRQVLANANNYAANDKVIGVIGTFNSGCAAIDHPGAEPGVGRRHPDGLAGEHVAVPDGQPPGRL